MSVTDPRQGSGRPQVPGVVLVRVVGVGSLSTVWSGARADTGEAVAVKITPPERYHVGTLLELAARESAILDRVRHEHVVRLHDVHPLADGSVAVVLDLVEGGSLAELISARGRLTAGEVATIATPIAGALAAVHEAGVVHGDVSAGNVLFTPSGAPMLADFESARLEGEGHPPTVAGTPGFLAPEVIAGALPTPASDVYALGALIWLALSGTALLAPAQGLTVAPSLTEAQALVGEAFAPVVVALLAEDPAARPSAAQAARLCYHAAEPVAVELVSAADADPAAALTRRIREQARLSGAAGTGASSGRHRVPRRPRRPRLRMPRPPRPRLPIPRLTSRAGALPPRRPMHSRRRRSLTHWRRWVLASLVTGLVVTLGMWVGQRVTNDLEQVSAPSVSGNPSPGVHPTPSAGAPPEAEAARDVLARLADARAAALVAADPDQLTAADAPGSPLLAADHGLLESMRSTGRRYADLVLTVRSASWVAQSPETAIIDAVIERSAYRVLGQADSQTAVPADPGRLYRYRLVRTEAGWRIADVQQPAAAPTAGAAVGS